MRFGLTVTAALALASAASAQAPAAPSPERQVVCEGQANGEHGERVWVAIHVDPVGGRLPGYAAWSPPQLARFGADGLDQPDLSLTMMYSEASAQSIGKPEGGFIQVSLFSPPRKPASQAKLEARLEGLQPSISYDGQPAQKLAFDPPNSALVAIPGTASRAASIQFPEPLPGEATVSMADHKGKPVVSQRYSIRDTASRDALYAEAWKQADQAATSLTGCEETADVP